MEFVIKKTSMWTEEKPCEEAYSKALTKLDVRTEKTFAEARKKHWFKEWYDNGINHRIENGYIVCDAKEKRAVWMIKIDTLDQLLAFIEKYGELIISDDAEYKENQRYIEIYDAYRE